MLGGILQQFYGPEQSIPDDLLLPFAIPGQGFLAEWLTEGHERQVKIQIPKRGHKVHLLQMAAANADQVFIDRENRERSWQEMAGNLQNKLKLRCLPARIECLDISNIGGKQPVGSLVCSVEGEKSVKDYRHYSITSAHEPDDYRMMAEVLNRRFKVGEEDGLPDLLVVDGGKGHLNVAVNVLKDKGLQDRVELASIAKDKENRSDKIYRPGRKNTINLARHSPVLFFLMQVRDESHRFGISFHRRLRMKKTLASDLDNVSGIGPARRRVLLKAMGSLAAVKRASREDLASVEGIGPELADQIWEYFHS